MLTASGLTDVLAQNTQSATQSGAQPNIMDDVMATISSSAQGTNPIEVPMSLSKGLTVAINSSVPINSNSGSMTTTLSSLEPFTATAVSNQSSSLFTIGGSSSSIMGGAGKMTPAPASYAETTDNSKGD